MRGSIGKYRGKSLLTGEWLYGSLLTNMFFDTKTKVSTCYIIDTSIMTEYDCFEDMIDYMDQFQVDPETVGELYSVTKNETKFYEGDIISSKKRPDNKHVITYCEEEARFDCAVYPIKKWQTFTGLRKSWLEEFNKIVIGTIHDKEKSC